MNKKSLLLSIIAVLLIGILISGSSFAYFQWTTAENEKTSVSVRIERGQITMDIEPETTLFTNLTSVADCKKNHAYADTLVTVRNETTSFAAASFKLKVRVTKGGSGELTSDVLSHIHYSVVLLETDVLNREKGSNLYSNINNFYAPIFGKEASTTADGACDNPLKVDVDRLVDDISNNRITLDDVYFKDDYTTELATGTFAEVSTSGEWTDIPSASDKYLPREYIIPDMEFMGVTMFSVPPLLYGNDYAFPQFQYFRVYVWIDENYSSVTVGNVVSDPLQNAKIEVTWSENSKIEQIPVQSKPDIYL